MSTLNSMTQEERRPALDPILTPGSTPEPALSARAIPAPSSTPAPSLGRVLVVDDNPDIRRLLGHFLRHAGAKVEFAEDGANCVRRMTADATLNGVLRDESPVDLILIDVEMPVMDGLTSTRALRAKGHRGPIIAVTARDTAADRDECLAAGCSAYLCKPVERHELIKRCTEMMAGTVPDQKTTLAA